MLREAPVRDSTSVISLGRKRPKSSGEYQQPAIRNPTTVAAMTVNQLIFMKSMLMFMALHSLKTVR
jgi:hypothetical protein